MFGQLFISECRQTARSMIYWLSVFVLIFNFVTQLGSTQIEAEPKKGQACRSLSTQGSVLRQ